MPIYHFAIAANQAGDLNPNTRMDSHIRSTAASFFRRFLGYGRSLSIGQSSMFVVATCVDIPLPSGENDLGNLRKLRPRRRRGELNR